MFHSSDLMILRQHECYPLHPKRQDKPWSDLNVAVSLNNILFIHTHGHKQQFVHVQTFQKSFQRVIVRNCCMIYLISESILFSQDCNIWYGCGTQWEAFIMTTKTWLWWVHQYASSTTVRLVLDLYRSTVVNRTIMTVVRYWQQTVYLDTNIIISISKSVPNSGRVSVSYSVLSVQMQCEHFYKQICLRMSMLYHQNVRVVFVRRDGRREGVKEGRRDKDRGEEPKGR